MAASAPAVQVAMEVSTFRGASASRREPSLDLARGRGAPTRGGAPAPGVTTGKRPSRLSTRRLAKRLEDLVLLKRIVRAGSINKAALELSISQSALSRRIERLEGSLGFVILERSPNGVRYASGVESLESYLDHIERSIEAMAGWIESQSRDLVPV